MRVDKFLKTARILKRREAAKELAEQGRVWVNGRQAKPGTNVEVGDRIKIRFGLRIVEVEVKQIVKQASKQNAELLFEVLSEEKIDDNAGENV